MIEPANSPTSVTSGHGSHASADGHHGHSGHDHGEGHAHSHGRQAVVGARSQAIIRGLPSAVRLGLAQRLAIAGGVCLMLWVAVLLVING